MVIFLVYITVESSLNQELNLPVLKLGEILLEPYSQVTSLFFYFSMLSPVVMPGSPVSVAVNLLLILHHILPINTRSVSIAEYL